MLQKIEVSYDDIFGMDLFEYCASHNLGVNDLLLKIEIDIALAQREHDRYAERNTTLSWHELNKACAIDAYIEKRKRHLARLREFIKKAEKVNNLIVSTPQGLNAFCKSFNAEVRAKGFWDGYDQSLEVIGVYGTHDMHQQTKDAFIAQKIALIQSEAGEILEAMRHGNYGVEKKDSFEDEIADVLLRTFDLCGELNIDIEKQLEWKRNHNQSREKRHGKGF